MLCFTALEGFVELHWGRGSPGPSLQGCSFDLTILSGPLAQEEEHLGLRHRLQAGSASRLGLPSTRAGSYQVTLKCPVLRVGSPSEGNWLWRQVDSSPGFAVTA